MDIKSWLKTGRGGRKKPVPGEENDDQELSTEDLIVLERYEEAEERLKLRLKKHPEDLHAHLRLAEVYTHLKKGEDAIYEYVYVAEEYARDGFYDKGIALLGKASRLAPVDEKLRLKTEALRMAKRLEHKRLATAEGMREGGASGNAWAMEVQRAWHHLARGSLIQRLSEDQLRRLFSVLALTRWEEGSVAAEQGAPGDELYLVLRGTLEARWRDDARDGGAEAGAAGEGTELRTFGPGDVVGESVLFERKPWPATYVAVEKASLLTLTRLALEKALVGNPDPRGLLDALRHQGHDQAVANMVKKLTARP